MDGGLATELEKRGHDLNDDLWSARLLLEQPAEITTVHRDYLEAGSGIVTSASYQATISGYRQAGVARSEAEQLIVRSVALARQACQDFAIANPNCLPRKVAAGVGPYGAALADGSEYTGNYDLDSDQLYEFHQTRWHLLLSARPDLVLCETIPSLHEARALIRLAEETDLQVWISFSCRNESEISDGTSIQQVARLILESAAFGIGINCTPPGLLTSLVTRIRSVSSTLPVLVYPNSGETWQIESRTWAGFEHTHRIAEMAPAWIELGVEAIGGCCRTTPDHIRALRDLRDKGRASSG